MNVLFAIVPLEIVSGYGRETRGFAAKDGSPPPPEPRAQAERLRDELKARLPGKLLEKKSPSNYASVSPKSGDAPRNPGEPFSTEAKGWHTLVVVPVHEKRVCGTVYGTLVTVLMSLRTPIENKEVWSIGLKQGEYSPADWIPSKNDAFIDDIAAAVLSVAAAK